MNTRLNLLGKRINMAPRARRRWLVFTFYTIFGALLSAAWFANAAGSGSSWITIEFTVLIGPLLGGYLSYFWGKTGPGGLVKPFGGNEVLKYHARKSRTSLSRMFYPEDADWSNIRNDERDLNRRDNAHYLAYRVLGALVVLAFLIDYMTSSPTVLLQFAPVLGHHIVRLLLQCGYILFLTLPSAILLWTEPDMEAE